MTTANKVWKNEVYEKVKPTVHKPILCHKCSLWVKCEKGGFCQCKPLFTFTAKLQCDDYLTGKPCKVRDWENM